jgi:hypothetical protein
MDVNGFRDPQSPWLFANTNSRIIESRVKANEAPSRDTYPTPDNRFPSWAAPMSDGRIATDYRPKCSKNIPAGQQFATRGWMQRNADELMMLSRKRQAELAGAGQSYDPRIEAPPTAYVKCDAVECGYTEVNPRGIGVERNEHVPDLFGTYAASSSYWGKQDKPTMTMIEEGGRNTVRGKFT